MCTVRIETPADHEEALAELERLIDANPARGTPEGARLAVLSALVEAYEDEHFPIEPLE